MNTPSVEPLPSYTISTYSQASTPLAYVVYALISALLVHSLLLHAGVIGISLIQFCWNLLVRVIPARLLFRLDPASYNPAEETMGLVIGTHAAKSVALSRILGLGTNNIVATVKRARTMSGLKSPFTVARGETPPGLGNWDSSCYQNSVIQSFAALSSLWNFLDRNIETLGHGKNLDTHRALKDIIENLNDTGNYGKRFWTPSGLKNMSSWQQQDAQEYFSKVMDSVDKELNTALNGRTDDPGLKCSTGESVTEFPSKDVTKFSSVKAAVKTYDSFRNPLEGLLAQRVGCMRCGYSDGLSLIPFNCLTVPLGTQWRQDIQDCLDQYTALEPIEGVECGKCSLVRVRDNLRQILMHAENVGNQECRTRSDLSRTLRKTVGERLRNIEAALDSQDFSEETLSKCHITSRNRVSATKSRQAVIASVPKSLVIHVNRSLFDEVTGFQRKNYAEVQFPKTLDLSKWCLGTTVKNVSGSNERSWEMDPSKSMLDASGTSVEDGPIYNLKAAIQHYGRHENGHYICYRKCLVLDQPMTENIEDVPEHKVPKQQWYRLSDDDVTPVSEADVLGQGGVFMLFYEAVDAPLLPNKTDVNMPITTTGVTALVSSSASSDNRDHTDPSLVSTTGPPRPDTPQTVVDLRVDQQVPLNSCLSSPNDNASTLQAPEEKAEPSVVSSQCSLCSSPRHRSSSTVCSLSPSRTKTVTPVMWTSNVADKAASHQNHSRNVPNMVAAV